MFSSFNHIYYNYKRAEFYEWGLQAVTILNMESYKSIEEGWNKSLGHKNNRVIINFDDLLRSNQDFF